MEWSSIVNASLCRLDIDVSLSCLMKHSVSIIIVGLL